VVATRMSLSFPLLISAVPLYAVDFSRTQKVDADGRPIADRCWFSDGGLCSNLPLHFFDAPLPTRPTFAINLKPFHPDRQSEDDAVWLPSEAGSGILPSWRYFEKRGEWAPLGGFLEAILDTMQNWQDNTQSRVPGYRDRLVHISQRDDEGGMNLDMPAPVIARLADRGRRAGEKLIEKFDDRPDGPTGWAAHRWVRFRSTMDLTFEWLNAIAAAYRLDLSPDASYPSLLTAADDGSRPYRLSAKDRQRAAGAMDALTAAMDTLDRDGTGLDHGPRPSPDLRIKPRI